MGLEAWRYQGVMEASRYYGGIKVLWRYQGLKALGHVGQRTVRY